MKNKTDYVDVINTICSVIAALIAFNTINYVHPIMRIAATFAASLLTLIVVDGILETLRRKKESALPAK